jgi:hypothetical protein
MFPHRKSPVCAGLVAPRAAIAAMLSLMSMYASPPVSSTGN